MTSKKARSLSIVTCVATFGWLFQVSGNPNPKSSPPQTSLPNDDSSDAAEPPTEQIIAKQMLGSYVGQFGPHRITVCLQNVIGSSVNGYSVVAGNERAFSGSLVDNPAAWELHAREPGDHPQDGAFVFFYHASNKHLTGTWIPNDTKLKSYTFDLPRRDFKYDPKQGQYPQASIRTLKTADVENMRPEDLRIMRNEIYARHGYTFRLKEVRDHFDTQDWYMPISFNVSTQLTPVEQRNETLIKKYENYGGQYYDAFGR